MKNVIIAAVVLLGTSAQATAGTVSTHELYLEQRVCHTVAERQTGYLRAGGETVKFITPEHQKCTWEPTRRIRSTTHYFR